MPQTRLAFLNRSFLRQALTFGAFALLHPPIFPAQYSSILWGNLGLAGGALALSILFGWWKRGPFHTPARRFSHFLLEILLVLSALNIIAFCHMTLVSGFRTFYGAWAIGAILVIAFPRLRVTRKVYLPRFGWLTAYFLLLGTTVFSIFLLYAKTPSPVQPHDLQPAVRSLFNPQTYMDTHPEFGWSFPYDIAYDARSNYLVASLKERVGGFFPYPGGKINNSILVMKPGTGEQWLVPLSDRHCPENITIDPGGPKAYANVWKFDEEGFSLVEVDLVLNPPRLSQEIALHQEPNAIWFDRNRKEVWVFTVDFTAFRFSTTPLALMETVKMDGWLNVGSVVVREGSDGELIAYLGCYGYYFNEWNLTKKRAGRKIREGFITPGLAYDDEGERFFTADTFFHRVAVIDRKTFTVSRRFSLDGALRPIAVDSRRHLLFVGDYVEGTLWVLSLPEGKEVARLNTGGLFRVLHYDLESGRMFGGSCNGVFEILADKLLPEN